MISVEFQIINYFWFSWWSLESNFAYYI